MRSPSYVVLLGAVASVSADVVSSELHCVTAMGPKPVYAVQTVSSTTTVTLSDATSTTIVTDTVTAAPTTDVVTDTTQVTVTTTESTVTDTFTSTSTETGKQPVSLIDDKLSTDWMLLLLLHEQKPPPCSPLRLTP